MLFQSIYAIDSFLYQGKSRTHQQPTLRILNQLLFKYFAHHHLLVWLQTKPSLNRPHLALS